MDLSQVLHLVNMSDSLCLENFSTMMNSDSDDVSESTEKGKSVNADTVVAEPGEFSAERLFTSTLGDAMWILDGISRQIWMGMLMMDGIDFGES